MPNASPPIRVCLAIFLALVVVACATPAATPNVEPTGSAGVQTQLAVVPTLEPLPTYTPYPTATPRPTHTPYPTATPYPVAASLPTYTPLPTLYAPPKFIAPQFTVATPTPIWLPTLPPRFIPPTPALSQWRATGNWYRDASHESTINKEVMSMGFSVKARVAALDAITPGAARDVRLSLGCVGTDERLMYVVPYSFKVPPSMDTLTVGIWDHGTNAWAEDEVWHYGNVVTTEDRAGVFITSKAQVRQILSTLRKADQNREADLVFSVGLYDSTEDTEGLWGEFDPTGLEDALDYLPCF